MSAKLFARAGLGALVLLCGAVLVLGAPPDDKGKGGGDAADAAGALYGDLYVIERDGAGVPITTSITYDDPEEEPEALVTVDCLQPITLAPCAGLGQCEFIPLNGEKPDFDPEIEDACGVQEAYADCVHEVSFGRESVSRSPAAVLDKSYAEALKALNSAGPQCDPEVAITTDAAGRLTLCVPGEDTGIYAWKTIDAPLENLGLYRGVMADGCFGKVTEEVVGEEGVPTLMTYVLDPSGIVSLRDAGLGHLVCEYAEEPLGWIPEVEEDPVTGCTVTPDPVGEPPDAPCWWESPETPDRTAEGYEPGDGVDRDDLLSAAVFIAAGADKTSHVTLDEVVNVNTYVGINLWTYERLKKQTILTVKYFPFADPSGPGGWFDYEQGVDACLSGTTAFLLTDAGAGAFAAEDVSLFAGSPPGVNLDAVAIPVCRDGAPLTVDESLVFCRNGAANPYYDADNDLFGCGGANWFTQAAEDARKTIWYLHNWSVPEIAY